MQRLFRNLLGGAVFLAAAQIGHALPCDAGQVRPAMVVRTAAAAHNPTAEWVSCCHILLHVGFLPALRN